MRDWDNSILIPLKPPFDYSLPTFRKMWGNMWGRNFEAAC